MAPGSTGHKQDIKHPFHFPLQAVLISAGHKADKFEKAELS